MHPELLRLPSLALKGTFLRAYKLLIQIVTKVGWDELLKFRSIVFVMEEEYRVQRALAEESTKRRIHSNSADQETSSSSEEDKDELPNAPPPLPNRIPKVKDSPKINSRKLSSDSLPVEAPETPGTMNEIDLNSNSIASEQINDNASQTSLETSPVVLMKGLSIDDIMRKVHKSPNVVGEVIIEESEESSRKPPVISIF